MYLQAKFTFYDYHHSICNVIVYGFFVYVVTHSNYKLIVGDKLACFTQKSTNSDPRCVLVIPGPLATLKLLCTSDLLHVITPKKQIKKVSHQP